jgi:hypothetical protein
MIKREENPVDGRVARAELGKPGPPIGRTRFSAIKRAMMREGKQLGRYVMVSEMRQWLKQHPNFSEAEVYHRKGCTCEDCNVKRLHQRSQTSHRGEAVHTGGEQ